ncbi:hypothetical protein ACS0TY_034106 [Phlomoides rotata]
MDVDPYEDEVPESFDDGTGVGDVGDGFIDQVESSQAWTTMRDNLETQMFVEYGGRGRKRTGGTTRRVWTFGEECELMCALNDLVVKGNKCDNGFKSGYLLLLENVLAAKFPRSDLKEEPHIN